VRAASRVPRTLRIASELVDVVLAFDRLTIDTDDDALHAEACTEPADQLGIGERRRIDRNLFRPFAEHLLRIGNAADAAGDTKGDVENRGDASHPAAIDRAAVRARSDVVEHELVGALLAIALRQ